MAHRVVHNRLTKHTVVKADECNVQLYIWYWFNQAPYQNEMQLVKGKR